MEDDPLFAIAKEQFEQSAFIKGTLYDTTSRRDVPLSIAYKDTQSYFSIYLNRQSFWLMRARLEGRKPWLAFNIDVAQAQPLIPPELSVMPPYAWAPFRVQISNKNDLHRLQRLFYATIQRMVEEHQRSGGSDESGNG
jgi:hypothetical protein